MEDMFVAGECVVQSCQLGQFRVESRMRFLESDGLGV